MAAPNQLPIYTQTPDTSNNAGTGTGAAMTAAAADYTGVSGNYVLEFTAGANGGYIEKLRFKAAGTNVAAVARVFLNNGNTPATATNNQFFGEVSLPATTASTTAATTDVDYPLRLAIPAGWRLYVGLGAAVAAGWNCVAVGGQY